MKTKRVPVYKLEDITIYFNINTERFENDEGREFQSFYEAKKFIIKEKEQQFQGEYLVCETWDGINKFIAKKKIYDDYVNEYKIQGDRIDKYGKAKVEIYSEDVLFPVTKENLSQLEKSRKMDSEGWAMINQAKQLKLTK